MFILIGNFDFILKRLIVAHSIQTFHHHNNVEVENNFTNFISFNFLSAFHYSYCSLAKGALEKW